MDIFLPPRCVRCGKVEIWLCPSCADDLPLLTDPVCPSCGRLVQHAGICQVCRESPLHVSAIRAAFLYEGCIRDAIHALKYRGALAVSGVLAFRMAEAWRLLGWETDVFVPVPLHAQRERHRGYNQSALLARDLAANLRVSWDGSHLQRVRNTASQTHLKQAQRWTNVQDAFGCAPPTWFAGKRVTLVDDVATTGATLDACAMVLLAGGAQSVNAFTLARAS